MFIFPLENEHIFIMPLRFYPCPRYRTPGLNVHHHKMLSLLIKSTTPILDPATFGGKKRDIDKDKEPGDRFGDGLSKNRVKMHQGLHEGVLVKQLGLKSRLCASTKKKKMCQC